MSLRNYYLFKHFLQTFLHYLACLVIQVTLMLQSIFTWMKQEWKQVNEMANQQFYTIQ